MTLASKFTIARIILAPLFVIIAAIGFPHWNLWAAGIFIVASLTDCIDGRSPVGITKFRTLES